MYVYLKFYIRVLTFFTNYAYLFRCVSLVHLFIPSLVFHIHHIHSYVLQMLCNFSIYMLYISGYLLWKRVFISNTFFSLTICYLIKIRCFGEYWKYFLIFMPFISHQHQAFSYLRALLTFRMLNHSTNTHKFWSANLSNYSW